MYFTKDDQVLWKKFCQYEKKQIVLDNYFNSLLLNFSILKYHDIICLIDKKQVGKQYRIPTKFLPA